ncbi:branched-chain amino acid transport system II carrier protein [Neobacillus notoginsengisoli]|uniref:Branched-chain amino acid transport system carrier protein n=1 Tax=Neobacillus notoginsengisoli TaxID=1578198 RepID=A0A417YVN2_9BACI|nr:branched-chain amino acid transport system II carrier protein [Neobacillus notoginsengisoli]RHW41483.1 branched-chain amino acid transport system II carrier protein [Neobacillus notoginsengisoli]
MKKFDTLFIGFMLFSMFFGAGNLIFPPILGALSGTSYWMAMAGFILTAVGLPFAVLLAVSLAKGGAEALANRVHPTFSTIFMVVVYLSIGPFLAIPRNATVAFEMGVLPFAPESLSKTMTLFVFSAIFFGIVYLTALNRDKMEKYMGRLITPVLLIAIVALCTAGFTKLNGPFPAPSGGYEAGAFFKGFLEGYNTMDALAALAFGIVILTAIKKRGVSDDKQLTRYTMKAAVIAGTLLTLVYLSVAFVGGKIAVGSSFESGTELLTTASALLLGKYGPMLLGLIFTLACFTTVVGLTAACGQYFSNLFPKLSYKAVVAGVAFIGFTLSNMGLAQILKVSVPFLVTAYPLTIVLITLSFFHRFYKNPRMVYGTSMLFTGVFAAIGGLSTFGFKLGPVLALRNALPFASAGMDWVLPAIVGALLGLMMSGSKGEKSIKQTELKAS